MAPASCSSPEHSPGSLSPVSSASTDLTDIASDTGSGSPFYLEPTFRSDPVDRDSIFVAPVSHDEPYDPMVMSTWRHWAARLVGLTAVAPELLALYLCRYQLEDLAARWKEDGSLSFIHMLLSFALLSNSMVGSLEGLSMATVKLGALMSRRHPRLWLLGDNVPSVDVFVTVCDEKFDIVRDTVMGALNIDYPLQRSRVVVTDDGDSARLRAWVNEMMADHCNLHYHARTQKKGWKAGNLNCAIKFTNSLPGGAAQCIAGIDADMIPDRRWLRTVTAHLMRNTKMGMVCPTQTFYNIPSDDPLYQANSFDWCAKRLVFDLAGNGWNYGSGWIMRRKAIDDIGGFPEDIVTEDVSSSAMAMAQGWDTMYLQESLQYGLVPETYVAYIKQMTRWHVGESQTANKVGFYGTQTKRMKPFQKWVQTAQGLNIHIKTPVTILNLVLLCLVFLTDMPLVHWKDDEQMRFLLRMDCAVVLLRWLHELHYSLLAGYRSTLNETCKAIYLSPYCFTAYVKAFLLPRTLGGSAVRFTPTGSLGNAYRERDPRRRAPVAQRLRHMVVDAGAWVHLGLATVFAAGVALRLARAVRLHVHVHAVAAVAGVAGVVVDWPGLARHVVRHVAWPSSPWLVAMLACLTPLRYAAWPPATPAREALMGRRDERGVRYPLARVRGRVVRSGGFAVGFVEVYTLYMVFVLAVFLAV